MVESNTLRVSLVERTSLDTPAALDMKVFASTGQTLEPRVGYQTSQTIRSDANVADIVRLTSDTGGGLPSEMVYPVGSEALWLLMRAAMRSAEVAAAAQVTGVTATAGEPTSTLAAAGIETGVEVGDGVRVLTDADAFVGIYPVTNVAAGTLTVSGSVPTAVNCKVQRGARHVNGVNKRYFDIEVARLEAGNTLFELYRKCVVDGFELSVSDGGISTISFSIVGSTTERGTSPLCLSYANPTAGPVMDCLGVPSFMIGGVEYSAKSFSVGCSNGIRARTRVRTLGPISFAWGRHQVTARASTYIENWTEMEKYTGNQPTSSFFVLRDGNGKALSIHLPRMKWMRLASPTQGPDNDDYQDGSAQAYLHPTIGNTWRMNLWP